MAKLMKPDEMQLYIMKLEKRIDELEDRANRFERRIMILEEKVAILKEDNKRLIIDTHNISVKLKALKNGTKSKAN